MPWAPWRRDEAQKKRLPREGQPFLKPLDKGTAKIAPRSSAVTYLEQAAAGAQVPQQLLVVLQAVMESAPIATIASRMMFFMVVVFCFCFLSK
jgi:hypothetical protein